MRLAITGASRPAFEVLNGGEVIAGHGVRRPAIEAANELAVVRVRHRTNGADGDKTAS